MNFKIFQVLKFINNRLQNIEKNMQRIEDKIDFSVALQRNHLVRIKNGEDIDDSQILYGRPYNDLSPQQAYSFYTDETKDILLLDVSEKKFMSKNGPQHSLKIPLEELATRYPEIQNKTLPILVISEVGVRSIMACEILIKKGHFNLNNISGGYKFWPHKELSQKSPQVA